MKSPSLRDYQREAIDQTYDWFRENATGNPCLVLPTGSGKSHIIAALCKESLKKNPDLKILMLTHVKELIGQNAEKMLLHWRGAPLGIYSSGMGKRELGHSITFAGIQSVRNRANDLGHIDLVIVDEAHLVSHKDEGGYRNLLNGLRAINPDLKVIGLTATPYRLGHGLITDKPAIFDALIEPVSLAQLIEDGHLSVLRSKLTKTQLEVDGVHKRGGEYIESELQAKVNTPDKNEKIVKEVIELAEDRKSWLFFCTGVEHAQAVAEILNRLGIKAACIVGQTPMPEREKLLEDFKSGRLKALTNANVLTTGFDYPDIDLIAMMRPTMSPGLYVQMAGRGMRIKSHTDHCLVLDFAGVVSTHGPITNIRPPKKEDKEKGGAKALIKVCIKCSEICDLLCKICPACGMLFPELTEKELRLHNADIMGFETIELEVISWIWHRHQHEKNKFRVSYYGNTNPGVTEYFAICDEGTAGDKARSLLIEIANKSKAMGAFALELSLKYALSYSPEDINELATIMNKGAPPKRIKYQKLGKLINIEERLWD